MEPGYKPIKKEIRPYVNFLSCRDLTPRNSLQIAIELLSKPRPSSHLATDYEVSRKFVYEQSEKAKRALDDAFAPTILDNQILFHLPITKTWLFPLILGLVLICHSSLRGVIELLIRKANEGQSTTVMMV